MVQSGRALDCGAGIGRVSKRLLLPLFSEVDLVEQNPAFLEKAKTFLVKLISYSSTSPILQKMIMVARVRAKVTVFSPRPIIVELPLQKRTNFSTKIMIHSIQKTVHYTAFMGRII